MRRALRTAALAAIAIVTLSGCLKMEMAFTLHEDDTADGTIVMAVQKGVGEELGMSDEDLLAELETEGSFDEFEGGTVEPYDDGEFVGQKVTFTGQPINELDEQDAGFTIVREGDEFVVGGALDTGGEDIDTSMLMGATMTLAVTFPGPVSEANGEIVGNTVTWDLLDAPEELSARGAASTDTGTPAWLWIAIGAAVVVAAAVAALLVVRSRRTATVPAEAPTDGDAVATMPPPVAGQAFAPEPALAPADEPADEPAVEAPAAEIAPTVEFPVAADTIELDAATGAEPEEDHRR